MVVGRIEKIENVIPVSTFRNMEYLGFSGFPCKTDIDFPFSSFLFGSASRIRARSWRIFGEPHLEVTSKITLLSALTLFEIFDIPVAPIAFYRRSISMVGWLVGFGAINSKTISDIKIFFFTKWLTRNKIVHGTDTGIQNKGFLKEFRDCSKVF